ncbi:MAG: FMN-binding protein [Treponema sp.]|nr:FMN-binding protein [Spirochaetia bacterium]MDD7533157.1 FMN-binding protein [Treponema sp.]MDY3723245.1 FMN-binding protein [Treponema sp.]MDY5757401.1 FMN-binding protein [Treponema sp.]MDY5816830.1 FMN-binding protein [Treponema sp.]
MAEKENSWSMIKLGLILCAYAVVACAMLALVNNFTAPKIAENQTKKVSAAMQEFFPESGLSFETINDFTPPVVGAITVDEMYVAKRGNEIVGGAAQVTGPTYDQGTILIGIKNDGTVTGLKFLKLTDSPGFGLKANDATFKLPNGKTFYGQFEGKNAKDGFVAGQNFDAISGATITSEAVSSLINEGTKNILSYFNQKGVEK